MKLKEIFDKVKKDGGKCKKVSIVTKIKNKTFYQGHKKNLGMKENERKN